MGTVDARADRVGDDIFTPGASVCDIRDGGDVELENGGRANRDNPARGAEVNDSECDD